MEKAGKDVSVRTAVMDGQVIDMNRVQQLKDLPTKEQLYTKIAVGVKAVPTKIARGVKAVPTKVRFSRLEQIICLATWCVPAARAACAISSVRHLLDICLQLARSIQLVSELDEDKNKLVADVVGMGPGKTEA